MMRCIELKYMRKQILITILSKSHLTLHCATLYDSIIQKLKVNPDKIGVKSQK